MRKIHFVSLDVPFPPDYGGVIDIYYRMKALKNAGFHIVLHTFEYGRGRNHDFKEVADEVFYYDRKKSLKQFFSSIPFIVLTRNNSFLLDNLTKDEAPILFEGQHCTFFLNHPALQHRKKMVRIHNVEWQYYDALAKSEPRILKRLYFQLEAKKLKKQETILSNADVLLCLSTEDLNYYRSKHAKVLKWSAHFPILEFQDFPQQNNTFLFHGNLSVPENEKVAHYLMDCWKSLTQDKKLVLAGKNPSQEIQDKAKSIQHVELVVNPSQEEMNQLLFSIPIHILFTFQRSGVKLKLYNSLQTGATCLVNDDMIFGTDLASFCEVINKPSHLIDRIQQPSILENRLEKSRIFRQHIDLEPERKGIASYFE
jgi:hypothetical protein